jgi:hypothetical protein
MDVRALTETLVEPAITARVRDLLARLDSRVTPAQREELLRWDDAVPHATDTVNAVRNDVDDVERLRARAARFAVAAGKRSAQALETRIRDVPFVMSQASAKPAVASAIVWTLVGSHDEDLASHLIQIIRERAGLTRLTARVRGEDLGEAAAKLPSLVAWFADRQVTDACAWIEAIPVPFGPDDAASLDRQLHAIEQARQITPRVTAALFAGFARRAAAFFIELSTRNLDSLGFALSREVELETEPSLQRRVEIAAWAWRAGHVIAPRGTFVVLGIPIQAPWPWRLELIAAEPGHGASGCLALLLRIVGEGPPPSTSRAPALLLVPDEPDADRGARFERWLAIAYTHATAEWRRWM